MRVQLPPPENWQDFEQLCLEVWKTLWSDPGAQKHGHVGQLQSGVDIFGRLAYIGTTANCGVQCKLRNQLVGSRLTQKEVDDEVMRATLFSPKLDYFTIATTAPRDAPIQEYAREISRRRRLNGYFGVQVYSWDDIADVITARPDLLRRLYGWLLSNNRSIRGISPGKFEGFIRGLNPILECHALFESDEVRYGIAEGLRIELRNVITELALNAFRHGGARACQIRITPTCLEFYDNGVAFDPLTAVTDIGKGVGLTYLQHFRSKWRDVLEASYSRVETSNVTVLSFRLPLTSRDLNRGCVIIQRADYYGGTRSFHEFVEIPEGCSEYVFNVEVGAFNPSSLNEFLYALLRAIPPESRVRLRFHPSDLMRSIVALELAAGLFPPSRLILEEASE